MGDLVTTFPTGAEADEARSRLDRLSLPYAAISPGPGYALVGALALAMGPEARGVLAASAGADLVCAGWADYRPPRTEVPQGEPIAFEEDVFGQAAVMVLAPCVADETKIRVVAHISGDLTEVFPYLNAEMKQASYNVHGPTFTFMDGHRMISAYPHRIAVAKADEIVDAWRVLEELRRRVNDAWARRSEIEPSYQRREKPPALEIYKRLPRTNCGACGERACLAFAVRVWSGQLSPRQCLPVFGGEYGHLGEALLEICRGLGVSE